ncbi:hypothetical protein GALMADRAFT_266656 [Galerina marginata CBS 339.88]|uniref:Secreted protein n=1 Tax=Galerina marginata (strain CBS 339.88) TaxID=685588 RepID=A0A067TGM0_GALM3|nr:hypothetical protein GALMADRAFT_266656 [Galerina marginata CBS 339.88]
MLFAWIFLRLDMIWIGMDSVTASAPFTLCSPYLLRPHHHHSYHSSTLFPSVTHANWTRRYGTFTLLSPPFTMTAALHPSSFLPCDIRNLAQSNAKHGTRNPKT